MAYKLYDKTGQEVVLHDLQDKGPWCVTGASFEEVFISKYGESLSLAINPAKTADIYAPDLLNLKTGNLGDLKTQNTPFFQASTRYGRDPQYAVTFNLKDYQRYSQYYPGIEIYFWVEWLVIGFEASEKTRVDPMTGIWKVTFEGIRNLIKTSPVHTYRQRINDNLGNAKGSYVFDLRSVEFEKVG